MSEADPRLLKVVRQHLRLAGSEPDWDHARLRDLGLDSMSAIDLVLDLESEFDIVMPDDVLVAETFETVGSLSAALTALTGSPP
ncbi:MAG: acyl carrier protein [Jatrophihabitans sp.]